MVHIEIDSKSGFCFGVINAIKKAEESLTHEDSLCSLGDIVHNEQEMARLSHKGLHAINHDELATMRGSKILFRAHGEPPSTYDLARENGIEIIDASCPVVLVLQKKIKKAYTEQPNAQIVIYGKKGHAEVNGLARTILNPVNKGWGDFLGTGKLINRRMNEIYLSYEDAKEYVKNNLNVKTYKEWKENIKNGLIPLNIPKSPDQFYKKQNKWFGWNEFLNTDIVSTAIKSKNFLSYEEGFKTNFVLINSKNANALTGRKGIESIKKDSVVWTMEPQVLLTKTTNSDKPVRANSTCSNDNETSLEDTFVSKDAIVFRPNYFVAIS
jgi:hypothetical protein